MALPVPTPSTATAGSKILASDWNNAVRDTVLYLLELQGGTGRRNLLVNGSFDIWQYSTSVSSIIAGSWTADQWYVRSANGDTVVTASQLSSGDTPSDSFYGIKVANTASSTDGVTEILQPIETQNAVKAAGHSASLLVRMNRGANFGAAGNEIGIQVITGTGSDEDYTAGWTGQTTPLDVTQELETDVDTYSFSDIPIPSDAREIAVRFFWATSGGADDSISIFNVQLSVGAAVTFENLNVAETYAECQRHYQAGEVVSFVGYTTSGTTTNATQVLPTTMRTTPAYTFAGNLYATLFPATSSTAATSGNTARTIVRSRVSNGTGAGVWGETYTLDARLI